MRDRQSRVVGKETGWGLARYEDERRSQSYVELPVRKGVGTEGSCI